MDQFGSYTQTIPMKKTAISPSATQAWDASSAYVTLTARA